MRLSDIFVLHSGGKLKLKDVMKELLPLAARWKIIGTLLGIEDHVISRIKADEDGVCDRMQEMLSVWLKQIDPPPTWTALAEAVEVIDELKAEEIRTRCVDISSDDDVI